MAESIAEQVLAKIQESLAAIVGDNGATYWYTPTVVRAPWFGEEGTEWKVTDSTVNQPIYAIRAGEERHSEETTNQGMRGELEVFILALHSFQFPETPFRPAPVPHEKVVNRMVRDVLRKLLVDVQLLSVGGAVENIFTEGTPVVVDRDRYVKGWAIAEIRFTVSYQYLGSAP